MTSSSASTISRQHVAFAIAGTTFGFLIGFVVAHQVYGGRFGATANAPETMGGQRGAPLVASQETGMGQEAGGAPGMGQGGQGGQGGPGGQGGQAGGPDGPGGAPMEQVKQELTALKKTIEADPKNLPALSRLGDMYMDAGMFDKAIEFYKRALDVDPSNIDIRTDMGTCLRESGKVKEALQVFQDSVARDPKHWKSWFNIGIVYLYNFDDYAKAEQAFSKAHDINPKDIDMSAVRSEIEKVKQQKTGKTTASEPS